MTCSHCTPQVGIQIPGICTSCGAETSQDQRKLCPSCSKKQNRCEICKKLLPASRPGTR